MRCVWCGNKNEEAKLYKIGKSPYAIFLWLCEEDIKIIGKNHPYEVLN
jgi:hypothetical protein